jgi:hypothetical protein
LILERALKSRSKARRLDVKALADGHDVAAAFFEEGAEDVLDGELVVAAGEASAGGSIERALADRVE